MSDKQNPDSCFVSTRVMFTSLEIGRQICTMVSRLSLAILYEIDSIIRRLCNLYPLTSNYCERTTQRSFR